MTGALIRVWVGLTWAVLASGVAGCRGPTPDPLAPPEIHYGEEVCAECGMIISDAHYAAAMVVEGPAGPTPVVFDDIGEMAAYRNKHPELDVLRAYVHDFDTGAWIDVDGAHFVRGEGLGTPMGTGVAAFADPERAAAFAAEVGGATLAFSDLGPKDGPANRLLNTPQSTKEEP